MHLDDTDTTALRAAQILRRQLLPLPKLEIQVLELGLRAVRMHRVHGRQMRRVRVVVVRLLVLLLLLLLLLGGRVAHDGQLVHGVGAALRHGRGVEVHDAVEEGHLRVVEVAAAVVRAGLRVLFGGCRREHLRQVVLVEHVAAGAFVDEDVPAEAVREDGFRAEEGAPARDHVAAVAVVFDVRDHAFGEVFGDGGLFGAGAAVVCGGHVRGFVVGGGDD